MSREKTGMELQDLIRRIRFGHSNNQIHRETGTHRTVIRKLRCLAKTKGWLFLDTPLPAEKEIYGAYHTPDTKVHSHPLEVFRDEFKRYVEKEYTYVVMHELIKDRYDCSESTVRRFVQKQVEEKIPRAIVIRERELSVMEVDFGHLGIVYDIIEKRNRVAYVFSGRLRYSAKAYRAVVFDQKQETFWECHINAFGHFGGVPERVVPDNLKAAVVKASFIDPEVNRGYRELAVHYGFLIDPCRPYHPEHKGGVEGDIKYIKRNFWSLLQERQRQKGREVPVAQECAAALRVWEQETADVRIIKGVGTSPLELFAHETAYLKPLPQERYDTPMWKKCKVNPASRINFNRSTYTVPERFIGKEVMIAANRHKIRVFYDHELITEHDRSKKPNQDIKKQDHLSQRALAYMDRTRATLMIKANAVGLHAGKVVDILLGDPAVSKDSSAWGIVSLAKKYGNTRVEAACRRALLYDAPRYNAVKRILTQNLDLQEEKDPVDSHGQRIFTFARVSGYFNI